MKTIRLQDFFQFQELPRTFTGIIYWDDEDGDTWHVFKRKLHRELGPAICDALDGKEGFFLLGVAYEADRYWQIMLEKYRGTEHEALCLVGILGK